MTELTKNEKDIVESWFRHDDGEISTERLFAMVCDDCNCDTTDVINAMVKGGHFKQVGS